MTSSPRGGGGVKKGFKMMTIDDKGGGRRLANDDVITEIKKCWNITRYFSKIFLKIYKFRTKSYR